MAYEQAFAAYCAALQSLIDAGASISIEILSHVWWLSNVWFDKGQVTVVGVDSSSGAIRQYSWRPDYMNLVIVYPYK